jgi:DNA gyrase subunit A
VIGMATRDEDSVKSIISANTHDDILFFTELGRVFRIKVHEIPVSSRQSKGVAIPNLIRVSQEEKVTAIIALPKSGSQKYLFFAIKHGSVKRVETEAFKNVKKSGVAAINLKPDDQLLWVQETTGDNEIAQITRGGQVIVYSEQQARPMGRSAAGVSGIRLRASDEVIETIVLRPDSESICVVSERGIGKKVALAEFRNQHRGGSGIRIAKLNDKTGKLAEAAVIRSTSKDLMIATTSGQIIRISARSIKRLSRQASGVILIRLNKEDRVSSITILNEDEEVIVNDDKAKP